MAVMATTDIISILEIAKAAATHPPTAGGSTS